MYPSKQTKGWLKMFSFMVCTENMAEEGKSYGKVIACGIESKMHEWMNFYRNDPKTIWCKVIRAKDGKTIAEYHRL